MEPWYSGAVVDAVREAKSRRALFIVYIHDETEQSQYVDGLWSNIWTKLTDLSNIVALRVDKDSQACKQFQAIYPVQTYPTTYLINGQNGQIINKIDKPLESSDKLEEILNASMKAVQSKPVVAQPVAAAAAAPTVQSTKTVDEKVTHFNTSIK